MRRASTAAAAVPERASALLQRKCACGTHSGGGECRECARRSSRLQRRGRGAGDGIEEAPPIVDEVLRTPGQPLDPATRGFMEPRFGGDFSQIRLTATTLQPARSGLVIGRDHDPYEQEAERVAAAVAQAPAAADRSGRYDFSGVRVHADARAAASARAVGAQAYTVGRDIVLDPAHYQPGTLAGRQLLAHELTHVVQQSGALRPRRLQRQAGPAPAGGGLSEAMLQQIARRLREAMAGWGTDEEAIYSSMAGRTQAQVDAIARVYRQRYQRDLAADLQSELNDSELRRLATLSPGAAPGAGGTAAEQSAGLASVVAVQLDEAMRGAGTDEESIYAALTGRTEAERRAIKDAYRARTKRELEADLRDDLSGTELLRALLLLNQGLLQPEDEIYFAIKGLGTDEATIYRVLRSLAGNAVALQQLQANYDRKYGDLIQDLRGDLNAEEYAQARTSIRPVLADADVEDCDSTQNPLQQPNTVRDAHARAFDILTAAVARSANLADPRVQAMAARHFGITLPPTNPLQTILWVRVRRALDSMRRADTEATYECEPYQNVWNGACIAGNVAVSLFNIHLCPLWWTGYPTTDERASVLLHEWGHKFGTGVNRIFESYCHSADFYTEPAENRVQYPDAYAGYAFELITGAPPPCR